MKKNHLSIVFVLILALIVAGCGVAVAPLMTGQPSFVPSTIAPGECVDVMVPVTNNAYNVRASLIDQSGFGIGDDATDNLTGANNVTVNVCPDPRATTGNYTAFVDVYDYLQANYSIYTHNTEYSTVNYTVQTTTDIVNTTSPTDSNIPISYGLSISPEALAGMATIPEGCFNMGDAFAEGNADELPVHNVCISQFHIDRHEVTNAEYKACVSSGACTAPYMARSSLRSNYYGNSAYDNYPVLFVNAPQANAYCAWREKRLPTEAEWEYAARGGLSGKRYPWGDTITGSEANYYDSGDPWDNDTSPVGYFAPNGYGLYDMTGNVREWISDLYDPDYYSVSPTINPQGPTTGRPNVVRGGSYYHTKGYMRIAYRGGWLPAYGQDGMTGFRCAADYAEAAFPTMTGKPTVSPSSVVHGSCVDVTVPVTSTAYEVSVDLMGRDGNSAGSKTVQNPTGATSATINVCTNATATAGAYAPYVSVKDATGKNTNTYIYDATYSTENYTVATSTGGGLVTKADSDIPFRWGLGMCAPVAEGSVTNPRDLGVLYDYIEVGGMVDTTRSYYAMTVKDYTPRVGQEIFVILMYALDDVNLHVYRDDSTFTNATCSTATAGETAETCVVSAPRDASFEANKKIYIAVDGSPSTAGSCFSFILLMLYF